MKRIVDIESEIKGENSLITIISESDSIQEKKKQTYIRRLFLQSVNVSGDEEGGVVVDSTAFKFSLYRMAPQEDLIHFVLKALKSCFHVTEMCIFYLNKFDYTKEIDDCVFKLISEEPIHDWYTAQLLRCKHLYNGQNLNEIYKTGLEVVESSKKHWFLKREFIKVLNTHPEKDFLFSDFLDRYMKKEDCLESQLPYYAALLVLSCKCNPTLVEKVLVRSEPAVRQSFDELCLLLGHTYQECESDFECTLSNSWFTSNFIDYETDDEFYRRDGIYYYLSSFYDVSNEYEQNVSFKELLGSEYRQALKYISDSVGFFTNKPEEYILQTDIFHQVLISAILAREGCGIPKTQLGNMINKLHSNMGGKCHGIKRCHELRCQSNKVHAYSQEEGEQNMKSKSSWFTEAKRLKTELSMSYRYLLPYIAQLS